MRSLGPTSIDVGHPLSKGVVRPSPTHFRPTPTPTSMSAGLMSAAHVVDPSSVGAHVPRPTLADDESAMFQPTRPCNVLGHVTARYKLSFYYYYLLSAYTGQYAAVCSGSQVQTSEETLTAQSLLLLGRCPTSPQSSSHSSVHEWLQATGTHAPPTSPVESVSSSRSELQQALAPRTEAPVVVPPSVRSSHASRMSRTSRCSATSSLAMEIFGFSREMSSHMAQMAGQIQAQETQRVEAKQREEAQRVEALKREEAQRAEALKREKSQRLEAQILRTEAIRREELALAREQMMAKMKADTEEASQRRVQALRKEKAEADEATRKHEQLYMEHELKRQKVMVEANTTLQQERVKADVHREVAHTKGRERREAEFRQ